MVFIGQEVFKMKASALKNKRKELFNGLHIYDFPDPVSAPETFISKSVDWFHGRLYDGGFHVERERVEKEIRETFIKASDKYSSNHVSGASFKTYVLTALKNRMIDLVRTLLSDEKKREKMHFTEDTLIYAKRMEGYDRNHNLTILEATSDKFFKYEQAVIRASIEGGSKKEIIQILKQGNWRKYKNKHVSTLYREVDRILRRFEEESARTEAELGKDDYESFQRAWMEREFKELIG